MHCTKLQSVKQFGLVLIWVRFEGNLTEEERLFGFQWPCLLIFKEDMETVNHMLLDFANSVRMSRVMVELIQSYQTQLTDGIQVETFISNLDLTQKVHLFASVHIKRWRFFFAICAVTRHIRAETCLPRLKQFFIGTNFMRCHKRKVFQLFKSVKSYIWSVFSC